MYNRENNSVRVTKIGEICISTVWLFDIPHGQNEAGEPLIFETMIFCDNCILNEYCERYATEEEAIAGHDRIVQGINDAMAESVEKIEVHK